MGNCFGRLHRPKHLESLTVRLRTVRTESLRRTTTTEPSLERVRTSSVTESLRRTEPSLEEVRTSRRTAASASRTSRRTAASASARVRTASATASASVQTTATTATTDTGYESADSRPRRQRVSQRRSRPQTDLLQPSSSHEVTVHTHDQPTTEVISDSIREVEVIGETDFVVSTRGGFFEWIGYGLKLSIPEDCLPTGMEECRINIKASLSGPFELPEGSDLLSPVFWISALCKFKKPVTLEIQHCASRDEASFADLNFVSTKCSQKELPYIFRQLDGGKFPADSSYGSIQLSHFSGFGITGRRRTPRAYCAQIYYTITEEASDWRVYFIITKDLDTLKTVVGKDYCQGTTFQIKFERNKISLDIPKNGQETVEGWKITPLTHPLIIHRKDVDNFKPGKSIPPKCVLLVEWDLEGQKPVRLKYKINFIGAEPNLYNLHLNPTRKEVVKYQSTSTGESVEYSQGLASKYPAGLDSEPKLPDLMNEVAAVIPSKWKDVGLQLGLEHGVLGGIRGEASHRYMDVFTRWKSQRSTTHPYTWLTIVQVLQTRAVGEERLADEIRNKLTVN